MVATCVSSSLAVWIDGRVTGLRRQVRWCNTERAVIDSRDLDILKSYPALGKRILALVKRLLGAEEHRRFSCQMLRVERLKVGAFVVGK